VAVYDLGGGTFDISILKLVSTTEGDIYQVLATNGDTHLGGDDLDNALLAVARNEIRIRHGLDLDRDPETVQELRKALIAAKHELSFATRAAVTVPLPDASVYMREFSRAEFEGLVQPILDRTMEPVQMALADAGLKPADIDEVVLVGGSTRVPLVRRMVEQFFGRRPHDELNPDEVVALGAAIQANILESGVKNMLLLDVTPLSLGIETMGGVVAKIIPRNSTIPASAQEMFTTGVDNQTGIDIHVLQGERELAADCRSLARFQLRVPPGPAGLARIEVKFLIDASGILQVSARDLKTGQEHSVEVQPSYGLTDAEIEKILEESIENAEQDFNVRQVIEARNEAETILRATEKSLAELDAVKSTAATPGDAQAELPPELPGDERRAIDAAIAALRFAVAGDDYKLIRTRVDELNQVTMPLAERVMNRALSSALSGKRLSDV
jgi:molecular chaperone DnaK (HSP70)